MRDGRMAEEAEEKEEVREREGTQPFGFMVSSFNFHHVSSHFLDICHALLFTAK